ncbi:MAG: ABC transporter permease [Planctomycetaceae bacterium]|nr:ABC transporter permease [Planctomycetaceae bacterium]
MKYLRLVFDNVRRNPVRTLLTSLGTIVLVLVVTLVWSILWFLDQATQEKNQDFKAIITERWRIPSQMPYAYASTLREAAARNPGDVRPTDSMTWTFFGGTTDKNPKERSRSNSLFAFAMQPDKLLTMMDDLDQLPPDEAQRLRRAVDSMLADRTGIVLGRGRLKELNKRVGETLTLYGINYKDIDLELKIIDEFPPGRYDESAVFNIDYLQAALDAYPAKHANQKHPMAEKSLNLVWLKFPNREAFNKAAEQIMNDPAFSNPAVKIETQAAGISAFLEAYRDLLWGMRYLLAPMMIVILSLVIMNAISISVRERMKEFAVMKVLGFQPSHLLLFVLGEAIVIGATSGAISAIGTYWVVNVFYGGLKFPIAFFGSFFIPDAALWWGPIVGTGAAFAGSFFPALQAQRVRVADVFSRIG